MQRYWGIFMLLAALAHGQVVQHAPIDKQTQCRADQRLWLSILDTKPASVSWKELQAWHHAMTQCSILTDPKFQLDYLSVVALVEGEQEQRLEAFLRRRNLFEQFTAEDEPGQKNAVRLNH
jgi:hypothetical protein